MKKLLTISITAWATFALAAPSFAEAPGGATASSVSTATELSPAQRATIASELVAKFQAQVQKTPQGDVRAWSAKLTKVVATADSANVLRATGMPTLELMQSSLTRSGATVAPSVIGSTIADTTYTPLPNGRCRVADSRVISSPLPANQDRAIDIEDIASYASQGGNGTFANGDGSTNCGIPSFATAIVVDVLVLAPTADGVFKVFPGGAPQQTGNASSSTPDACPRTK